MKNFWKVLFLSIIAGILVSCDPENVIDSSSSKGKQPEEASDFVWDTATENEITLNNTTISTTSESVIINGTKATITKAGYYSISGTLDNGQIAVDVDSGIVKIKFNGVTISNSSTSPFNIIDSQKTILFIAAGTTNTLSDASSYSNTDEPNATIFSNSFLGITGTGSLIVKGNYNDGISSDDQVVINDDVAITVTAKDDGIRGKDYLKINGGTIKVTASAGHALKSDNSTDKGYGYVMVNGGNLTLSSTSKDGIHGIKRVIINDGTISISATSSQGLKSDSLVLINGGSTTVTASHEGIESPNITFNGGVTNVTASNDGLNATYGTVQGGAESNDGSYIYIKGGVVIVSGNDALDSNGNLIITGGTTIVNGPSSGVEEGIDVNGTFNINGGFVISSGSKSNMAKAMSTTSTQPGMFIKSSSMISSSSLLHIQDGAGNDLLTFKPKNGGYYFHFSSSSLSKGETYNIYSGGSYSNGSFVGGTSGYGLYTGGTYSTSGASLKKSGTLSTSTTVNTISF